MDANEGEWGRFAVLMILAVGSLGAQQTSTTLSPSTDAANLGQVVTLTATVSPAAASGKVAFYDGFSLLETEPLVGGQAMLKTGLLPFGVRSLHAHYTGGGSYAASTSATVPVTVSAVAANGFKIVGGYNSDIFADSVAVADFNGDGVPDLIETGVSIAPQDYFLTVQFGNGDGTFYATSSNYISFSAIGDFNGDGKADLINNDQVFFGNGDGTFQSPVSYTGAENGWIEAVGDFNGDGNADLVVGGTGTVSILLGNGDGSFRAPFTIAATGSAVVGDFNGDGMADLAVINPVGANTSVSVFIGNGDGTFRTGPTSAIGSDAFIPVVGDFNRDGKADLAIVDSENAAVVLLGNGDGTFRPPVSYGLGPSAVGDDVTTFVTGDFNGDGKADLAVSFQLSQNVNVLLGNGDGTFQSAVSYATPNHAYNLSMASGCWNGDGRSDLIVVGEGIVSLLGTELPTPTVTLTASPNPSVYSQNVSLTAAISAANATGTVTFYDGATIVGTQTAVNGQSTVIDSLLTPGQHSIRAAYGGDTNFAPSSSAVVMETVNLASSSSTTLLTSSANSATYGQKVTLAATVLAANPTGTVTFYDGPSVLGSGTLANGKATLTTGLLPSGIRSLTATYSGDVTYSPSTSAVLAVMVHAVPANGFQAAATYSVGSCVFLAAGNFNGNSTPGLAAANCESYATNVSVYLGNGDGTLQPAVNYATGRQPFTVAVADFNRDGKTDLVTANFTDDSVSILLGNGDGTFQPAASYPVSGSAQSVAVGDFNGDGKADLVVSVTDSSSLDMLLGNGDGSFQPAVSFAPDIYAEQVAVGDFNGDGKADLIVVGYASPPGIGEGPLGPAVASVMMGNGDGTFQPAVLYGVGASFNSFAVGDLNGDGKADLAVSNDNNVGVLINNGDGSFQPPVYYGAGNSPDSIAVGDLNGDGKADMAVTNSDSSNVSVLSGNGDGTFWPAVNYATSLSPTSIVLADFNGDGRIDLAVGTVGSLNVLLGTYTAPASVVLKSSLNPSTYGQGVTLAASVTPSTATGSITFMDGSATIGMGVLAGGSASLVPSLAAGAHSLTAVYGGDSNDLGSTSAILIQTVNAITTGTTLSSSVNPSSLGQNVTLTATVTPATATGSVTFKDGAATLGTVGLSGGSAVLVISNLAVGAHSLTAIYGSDTNDAGSTSGTLVQTVNATGYSISGIVLFAGNGLSGVTVTLTGTGSGVTVTGGSGSYNFSGLGAGGNYTVTPTLAGYSFTPPGVSFSNLSGNQTVNFTASFTGLASISGLVTVSGVGLSGVAISVNGTGTGSVTTNGSGTYSIALATGGSYTVSAALQGYNFSAPVSFSNLSGSQTANFSGTVVAGLDFYAVTPCRIADTRAGAGFSGQFGPPSMPGNATRTFAVPASVCGVPATASAYSLNFTAAPPAGGPAANLTTWPAGIGMPNVSTLNYAGSVVANAAIVPAGANGAISVFVNDPTDVLFDIDGYFGSPLASGMQFYPVSPCRVADTRAGAGKSGAFRPPSMAAGMARAFPVPSSGCGIPATAAAYSVNFTVVPHGYLGVLTTWPTGEAQPNVSTLNSYSGTVVANAAIVPAGGGGAISVYTSDATDVLFDINGYFAPPGSGLQFYPVTPCRVVDTRAGAGKSGAFGPPSMAAGTARAFPIPSSSCGIPGTAAAYSLNFTVVPQGYLGVLTTWPTGQAQPGVSTLNSYSGAVVANAAMVPAGSGGAISVYVSDATDLVLDINGYFGP